MNFQRFFVGCLKGAAASALLLVPAAFGQMSGEIVPSRVAYKAPGQLAMAAGNNLYCAGYVQRAPFDTSRRLVGALEEQDGFQISEHNVVYLNAGANKGVREGDLFSVIRPRGRVKTRWTSKGNLGVYTQEVGLLEVIRVKAEISAARVKTSCDSLLLGDLVQPVQSRVSPQFQQRPPLDLFAEPSGKAVGRLFMARDNQEMITRDQIVYIDLGAEDNVSAGDRLTVFRPLGKGNILLGPDESVSARDYGFESLTYKGGKFSNQAARKQGDHANGRVVTTRKAKRGRGKIRKVVGELMIINVKERTATAVITRTAQEIHTGDWVEVQ